MAQLAGADAGYEDASAYTASSPFLYNAAAFGQNIPYVGGRSTEPSTLGKESASSKSNPYHRAAADTIPNQVRSTVDYGIRDQYATFGSSPVRYTRTTDGTNTTSKTGASAGRHGTEAQGASSAFKTLGLPAYGPGLDRINLKIAAVNPSDSVVRRRTLTRYVWGNHSVKQ